MDQPSRVPRSRHALFWLLAAGCCALDLGVKHWMFAQPRLAQGAVWWLWPGHMGWQLSLNEGALFGMGQGKVWVFAVCSTAAAIAIPTWLFVFGGAKDAALTTVLGCILGGVLGNLYDRLGLPGLDWAAFDPARAGERVHAVRDFILCVWRWDPDWQKRVVWPNFNLADSFLVCGAVCLLLLSLRKPNPPAAPVVATSATS